MVIKGELKAIGNGFRKVRSKMTVYDYIILGEYKIKQVGILSDLETEIQSQLGQEIELSIYKGFGPFLKKSIVAMRKSDGQVVKQEGSPLSIIFGLLFLTSFLLAIPYVFLFLLITFGPINLPIHIAIRNIIFLHIVLNTFLIVPQLKAFGALGNETKKLKNI